MDTVMDSVSVMVIMVIILAAIMVLAVDQDFSFREFLFFEFYLLPS